MIFIKSLLATTGLLDGISTKHSIACINTSRPIYLVLGETPDHPIYVIRKITDANGLQASHTDRHIYKLAGDLVPEPIGRYELSGESYDVQRGVKGSPWFQLKANITTKKARDMLEDRMWQTLHHFQAKILPNDSSATADLQPLNELDEAFSGYQHTDEHINDGLATLMDKAVAALSHAQSCPSAPQHGDFCLNNLIIDIDHITVIDFEDFDLTRMPLYDHFTLALSLPSCGDEPSSAARIFNHPAILTAANILGISENTVRWHFLHHLLLRLGHWSTGEKRSRYRAWLKRVLDCFINDQTKYTNVISNSSEVL